MHHFLLTREVLCGLAYDMQLRILFTCVTAQGREME
jgi:hypothetical protein